MKISHISQCLVLCILVFSCKPKVPDEYLQPGEFEDILYDYHLADAMANKDGASPEANYNVVLYRQAVLKKYGITQADFDSSLVYYTRHSDRLHQVYENLVKRFEDDAMSLGASANDIRRFGDMRSERDTSNLWVGQKAVMLTTFMPYNVSSFEIKADSTYHKGDRIILSFNCDFVYNGGGKDACALLAVEFKNDSVASSIVRMSSNSNYTVTVSDNNQKGIKAIRGFIYLESNNDGFMGGNELCLMFVDNIRMVRMRGVSSISPTQTVGIGGSTIGVDSVRNHVGADVRGGVTNSSPTQSKPNPDSRPLKFSDVRHISPMRK